MITQKIFVLNINNYQPEITKYTYPTIEAYADKIGAEIVYITERKYPDYPVTFEKHQIYDLADTDWSIYIDSDVLIHPEFFDVASISDPNKVIIDYNNVATGRYYLDNYFLRDNRFISVSNFISWVSSRCIDYWKPDLDRPLVDILKSIYPLPREEFFNIGHRIDDYLCSRNIAKYGLKVKYIDDIFKDIYGHINLSYYYHTTALHHKKVDEINCKYLEWFDMETYSHKEYHEH